MIIDLESVVAWLNAQQAELVGHRTRMAEAQRQSPRPWLDARMTEIECELRTVSDLADDARRELEAMQRGATSAPGNIRKSFDWP